MYEALTPLHSVGVLINNYDFQFKEHFPAAQALIAFSFESMQKLTYWPILAPPPPAQEISWVLRNWISIVHKSETFLVSSKYVVSLKVM